MRLAAWTTALCGCTALGLFCLILAGHRVGLDADEGVWLGVVTAAFAAVGSNILAAILSRAQTALPLLEPRVSRRFPQGFIKPSQRIATRAAIRPPTSVRDFFR